MNLIYKCVEFEEAELLFEELSVENPHSLDYMDSYANVLYVMEKRAQLSRLGRSWVMNILQEPMNL